MIKTLLLSTAVLSLSILYSPNYASADNSFINTAPSLEACKRNVPYGDPQSLDHSKSFLTICHEGYETHLDIKAKIPDWVSYVLTEADSLGCESRSNRFKADPYVPSNVQATLGDYDSSGYDRGHMANDDDMRWDHQAEIESFYLTNMEPQKPHFNRIIWKHLEDRVRDWTTSTTHNMNVISGPIYNINSDQKMGSGKVDIPTGFWKIIIDTDENKAIAFEFKDQNSQEDANDSTLSSHLTSINNIEHDANLKFTLPSSIDKSQVSSMWAFNKGQYLKDKKSKCKNED